MNLPFYTQSKGLPKAVIKKRYEDFLVEEISLNKEKCRIVSLNPEKNVFPEIPVKTSNYLYLNLTKTNHDLHYAIRKIARFCRHSHKKISYAGIKDKRAITCQKISIYKPDIERIKSFSAWGIKLSKPEWRKDGIKIGDLKGNAFTVTIREINLSEKETKKRITETFKQAKKGIPNYFGEQRFGGIRKVSHLVGKHLLKNEIKKAVLTYLTHYSEKESSEVKKARIYAKKGELKKAFDLFPKKYFYERAIISHLKKNPKDFAGAFSKIPKKIRYLFTHAWQAYYFNELIAMRTKKEIGLKPVEGEPTKKGVPLILLPGYNSKFSPGKIGKIEKELLKKHGLTLENFKMKTLSECSCKGSRRKALFFPKKARILKIKREKNNCTAKISFELEKGCYATSFIREIIK